MKGSNMKAVLTGICLILVVSALLAADLPVSVKADCSAVPELKEWCENAKTELLAWYPRICNLLLENGAEVYDEVFFNIEKSDEGVGATVGNTITAYSGWITKHPDDVGMLIHELTHVIQRYPNPEPWWVTEGIADYIRWAIYEGKPLEWFSVKKTDSGYTDGYRVTAGFFLWLESGAAPGIVRHLNRAMRAQNYNDKLFEELTGKTLSELWKEYLDAREKK